MNFMVVSAIRPVLRSPVRIFNAIRKHPFICHVFIYEFILYIRDFLL